MPWHQTISTAIAAILGQFWYSVLWSLPDPLSFIFYLLLLFLIVCISANEYRWASKSEALGFPGAELDVIMSPAGCWELTLGTSLIWFRVSQNRMIGTFLTSSSCLEWQILRGTACASIRSPFTLGWDNTWSRCFVSHRLHGLTKGRRPQPQFNVFWTRVSNLWKWARLQEWAIFSKVCVSV